jgi:hypothetical protein
MNTGVRYPTICLISEIQKCIYIKADRFPLMMLTAANKERKQI